MYTKEQLNALKELDAKENERINNPKTIEQFNKTIDEIGHHIDFQISDSKNGVQQFKIFDLDTVLWILNMKTFFKIETQSLFYDENTKLSYSSIIIDFPNKEFNNKKFDDYCVEICKNWFLEKGLEFSENDSDILVSYPSSVQL